MFRIGIDVGSTYTKYCVMEEDHILELISERTPLHQKEYFQQRVVEFTNRYPNASIVSCGYGKANVEAINNINELIALAKGSFFVTGKNCLILDIGGQDTKIIRQEKGKLIDFFISDKCAAGSGMFLSTILNRIEYEFEKINFYGAEKPEIQLSSTCAVFAQSEVVELIADNRNEEEIIRAVVWQIFVKSKKLLDKVENKPLILSGGLSQIKGISEFAGQALKRKCEVAEHSAFLSAIGCAVGSIMN